MSVHGVVSLNITIVFTSGLGDRALQELKQLVCLDTGIQPSHLTDDPPTVVSQQALEETLARLGISARKLRSETTGLQPVIDRIASGIQRLEHQLQILDDAQKRLDRLVVLASEEVDWDDPVTRIRSEEALFDCE
ncbi:hypothetical protein CMUS01_01263 [Colletotrichum musicola]|uniref:Uncharacterized protein n=1 Tax=Colletotrichum musicola TaxID=2175873 RepID=A0A8H6NXB2_9PEZI|nr:hypothetical protein CMUS01_01263 [Colletotrichum musicola]